MEGFTDQDRKILVTCEVQIGHLLTGMGELSGRVLKLEDTRVSRADIDDLQDQIHHLRDFGMEDAEKIAPAIQLLNTAIKATEGTKAAFDERLRRLEDWRWKVIGIAAGASTAIALISKVLFH